MPVARHVARLAPRPSTPSMRGNIRDIGERSAERTERYNDPPAYLPTRVRRLRGVAHRGRRANRPQSRKTTSRSRSDHADGSEVSSSTDWSSAHSTE